MSHFYADIQGNRGVATRGGSKASGIDGHIRGYHSGARVACWVNDKGQDVVEVYATHGSGYYEAKAEGLILRTIDGELDFLTTKKKLLGK